MAFNREEVVQHIDKLPAFSSTVAKVMQLANNPKSAPSDLIQAISLDPLMTAKVLGLINSAYFSMREKVVSLKRAVIMLGFNTIKNIAVGSAVVASIKLRNNYKWFTGDQFWEHCLGVGIGARMIAANTGVSAVDQDEYFIAGLLHDIGKVVYVQYHPEEYAAISDAATEPGVAKTVLELREFGIDHAELGGLIAKKWELPRTLLEPIGRHHSAALVGEAGLDKLISAVHVANCYCREINLGIKGHLETIVLSSEALKTLGIVQKNLPGYFADLEKKVEDAKIFLKG
ncbi:MAG: HDOD domain-containing protein [Nitrospinae bacterium]|nr:HDOD domain-containing protein [Nitrospinota bacterium]